MGDNCEHGNDVRYGCKHCDDAGTEPPLARGRMTDLPDAVVEAAANGIGHDDDCGPERTPSGNCWCGSVGTARAALAAASGPWAEQLEAAKRDGQIEVARAFQAWAATNEIAENIDWKWFGEICRRYSDIYEGAANE